MTDTTLQLLLDRAAIERAVYDYAAAIDHRDYVLLRSVLTDELHVALRPAGEVRFAGLGQDPVPMRADQFVERNRVLFIGFAGTHHQITNIRIDIDGDTAKEAAYLQATHFLPGEPDVEYSFGAFYANELERTPDGWKFARIDLSVTWERGDARMTERARTVGLQQVGA